MNATITRFGYPDTLIAELDHWIVLLRPSQPTLGSLILAAKGEATNFASVSESAFRELHQVVVATERMLTRAVAFQRINYLMLMMVDPHVHFHVIPRYQGDRSAMGTSIIDAGWPKAPMLEQAVVPDHEGAKQLVDWLRTLWIL